ncbi:MAG: SDR family oxidoreductase [Spirochaetia bacterium]|nr:MAG: SDR family oxidoreductase [Spirochaetia bacterium]
MLAAHVSGLHPALLLVQDRDDLLLAEPDPLHVRILTKSDASSNWRSFRGARHDVTGRLALPRVRTADEAAAVALFLLSDDAAFVTGAQYHVDGGLVMQ